MPVALDRQECNQATLRCGNRRDAEEVAYTSPFDGTLSIASGNWIRRSPWSHSISSRSVVLRIRRAEKHVLSPPHGEGMSRKRNSPGSLETPSK